MKNDSIFKDFTHRYELSKTLRFELKPIGMTEDLLERDGIFEEGREWKEKYEKSKRFFDRLHREFVEEALRGMSFDDMDGYFWAFRNWRQGGDDEGASEALKEHEKELREKIGQTFHDLAAEWTKNKYGHLGLKESGIDFLFGEGVFRVLKERYGSEKDVLLVDSETGETIDSIFDNWKGFTGYFKKFHETRRNFYRSDGISSAIATRIIDQNLRWFAENILIFEDLQKKIDFKGVEKAFGIPMVRLFSLDRYGRYLLQDGIDAYNGAIVGNGKQAGINGLIAEYLQEHKGEDLPFLKTLGRQILGAKEGGVCAIETDEKLLETLRAFHSAAMEKVPALLRFVEAVATRMGEFDLEKIYISKEAAHTISHKFLENSDAFPSMLFSAFRSAGDTSAKYRKESDSYSFPDFISFSRIKDALSSIDVTVSPWKPFFYQATRPGSDEKLLSRIESVWEQNIRLAEYQFTAAFRRTVILSDGGTEERGFVVSSRRMGEFLASKSPKIDSGSMAIVKDFADDVLRFYRMGRYFSLEKDRLWNMEYEMDPLFYSDPETGYMQYYDGAYEELVLPYGRIREYLARRPWENAEKWRLNFGIPTLADGWDKNKESVSSSVILRREGRYYLGIMRKGNNRLFEARNAERMHVGAEGGRYEKMEYKLFPDPAKMMPKVCFSEKGLEFFGPAPDIVDIYKKGTFKKGSGFNPDDMRKLIGFYRDCLGRYPGWKEYDFSEVKTAAEYGDGIADFFSDVARAGYRIAFTEISASYIEEKNREGELYLFEVHNRDYASGTNGRRNLHTMYFEGLFPPNNSSDFTLKLNGQSELFFRPAISPERLGIRKDATGKSVVAQKRYAENKILFHCPVTLNRGCGAATGFNRSVNAFLAGNPNVNVIGVDRGEKNLVCYSVVNQRQEVIEAGSLNEIDGVDYAEKIREKEKSRGDWRSNREMRDLKLGYVTQVVRKLADLAIRYDAILVLEDFNMRFKRVRGGIGRNVHQQMEKALIEKLGYLVMKDERELDRTGNLLSAFQLAPPFESFQKMGKQTGIVFYVQAGGGSQVDPITGWRPNLRLRYRSAEKTKAEILKFSNIAFVPRKGRFEMTYDLKGFQERKTWPKRTVWTVCSSVERYGWDGSSGDREHKRYPDLTDSFRELFEHAGIDIGSEIIRQISELPAKGNEKFFKAFVFFWNLLCQIRNEAPDGKDFILSPVEPFFDSRDAGRFGKSLPNDGDEAGAYAVARKGVLILSKLKAFRDKSGDCSKLNWGDLYISNDEWDDFVSASSK